MPENKLTEDDRIKEKLLGIREASYLAIEELIAVASKIIVLKDVPKKDNDEDGDHSNGDIASDRLTRAAAAKKLAIFDSFDICNKIKEINRELESMDNNSPESSSPKKTIVRTPENAASSQ